MKKFRWRLGRVLQIREKQEQTQRAELMAMTEKLAGTRGELLMERRKIQNTIERINKQRHEGQMGEQEMFLRFSAENDKRIKELESRVTQLQQQQKEKMQQLQQLRKFKEGLRKLHDKAKEQFIAEQEKLLQKELDERASTKFASELLENDRQWSGRNIDI